MLSHVGHIVSDIERSVRFYVDLLGFAYVSEARFTADQIDDFLKAQPPRSMHAVYLTLGSFTLELMQLEPGAESDAARRTFNASGLTHLSFALEDPSAVAMRAEEFGGTVFSQLGKAFMIRDPDGQFIELLGAPVVPRAG